MPLSLQLCVAFLLGLRDLNRQPPVLGLLWRGIRGETFNKYSFSRQIYSKNFLFTQIVLYPGGRE